MNMNKLEVFHYVNQNHWEHSCHLYLHCHNEYHIVMFTMKTIVTHNLVNVFIMKMKTYGKQLIEKFYCNIHEFIIIMKA